MSKLTLTIAHLEQSLAEQGCFSLVDWLLKENHLPYSTYEAWRNGKYKTLEDGLSLAQADIDELIVQVRDLCFQLGLSDQTQDYYGWGDNQGILKASADSKRHTGMLQQWLRPQDLPQLDLFMDNSLVITENSVLDALGSRQFEQAQTHLSKLTELNPTHEKLGNYQDLLNYGIHVESTPVSHDSLMAEVAGLEKEVLPLAKEALKNNARDYLALAWRRLGNFAAQMPYDRSQPTSHSSYLFAQIPDWQAVMESLKAEAHVFTTPVLIQRLALCYEALKQEEHALLCWCLLLECDSDFCETAIEDKASPLVWNLWQDYWESHDGLPVSFFSAFVLAVRPAIVRYVDDFPSFKWPSNCTVLQAIQARIAQQDDMSARKAMQEVSPALLRLYLSIRQTENHATR